jgi:predicted nucleic acid-binding protein
VRAYLDSVPIIYLIEQNPHFAPAVERWLLANPCDLVSSELARMECLIVPVRNSDAARVGEFENFFRTRVVEVVTLTRAVFDRAIEVRSRAGFKTPDALHLAAAVEAGCDVFVTNDHQLTRFTGIRVELI